MKCAISSFWLSYQYLVHDENIELWTCASLASLCHFNAAVIHQESWELHWKKGTNVPIEPKSHMVKHSIPLWQVEKEIPWSSFCFQWTERLGVCVWKKALVRQLHCMASHIWQPIYLKLHPSSPAALNSPWGPDDGVTQLSAVYSQRQNF